QRDMTEQLSTYASESFLSLCRAYLQLKISFSPKLPDLFPLVPLFEKTKSVKLPHLKKKRSQGFPWCCSGEESACQCRRHRSSPWSWKIPHAAGKRDTDVQNRLLDSVGEADFENLFSADTQTPHISGSLVKTDFHLNISFKIFFQFRLCKNTGVGCHALLQGVFPTQGSNPALPHSLLSKLPGKPKNTGVGSQSLFQGIFLTRKIVLLGTSGCMYPYELVGLVLFCFVFQIYTQEWNFGSHDNIWKIYCYGLYQRVSQYTFAMCSYREKKSEPQELMQLEGYTVDYTDPHPGLQGGHMFFNAVKEGDTVIFASDDEQDRILWVQAMYRATGQSYKPVPAIQAQKLNPKGGSLHADAQFSGKDADRFQKHGMDEFISANPCKLDHAFLFRILQRQTLDHRLNDSYSCLGWFSPGQVFVLDEYCARYGVRGCHRHLCYLTELMEHSENGAVIDPTLLHYSFAFCASHVHGNRYFYLQTHSEMWRVLMKDIATPIPAEEVKKVVRKCLEKAALINYTRLTEYAKIEETMNQATPARKLEEVLHLAELCIEVLQQNEEHHAEAFAWWPDLLAEHAEKFWALFTVDMDTALEAQPQDSWDSFPLFQLLNNFLRNDVIAYGGPFPRCLFLYRNIANSLPNVALPKVPSLPLNLPQIPSFSTPSWMASLYESTNGSATSEDLFWKLDALQMFVFDLHWPEQEFAHHLEQRLKLMASDMIEACVKRTRTAFELKLQKASKTTDLRIPASMCTMFNVLVDAKKQSTKLCALDGGQEFVSVLEGVLSKLSRYDEGTFFSSILSFTVKAAAKYVDVPKPGMDLADTYIMFVRQNQDILREKVNEEMYIEKLFDKTYRDFRLQGVLEGTLNSKTYDTLHRRLTVEEATASVSEGGGLQGITMKDSDEEEEG
ncbi:hypothetical protein FD755_012916, partial [Muntiacus reevesi]